jgi:glucoamylase
VLAGLAIILAAAGVSASIPQPVSRPVLLTSGIAENPCAPQQVMAVPADVSGVFEPGTSVLRIADGILAAPGRPVPLTRAESACVAAATQASQRWLASGLVPGRNSQQHAMSARALLDLRLLVGPNGAVAAGWRPIWQYAWPRDSSWVAVALADTGHTAESLRILRFLQRVQAPDGTWAARYRLDGSGPVRDHRPAELDAVGWVPWAAWSWYTAAQPADPGLARSELDQLWPMVTAAADAAARSLTGDGLPGPSMDYWEEKQIEVTLGTAAPLLAGLRAAADLARDRGARALASHWNAAATRLSAGIGRGFGKYGFNRVAFASSGPDAAITFLGPPLAAPGPAVLRAASAAQQALQLPDGGLQPGTNWAGTKDVAWTPETALFALFDAATGQHQRAAAVLSWLAGHRTALGELPEQVNAAGHPVSVAPLAWTDAIVVLATLAQAHQLPVPGDGNTQVKSSIAATRDGASSPRLG